MKVSPCDRKPDWAPSVYYAESLLLCALEHAWTRLLDYRAWNPTFIGAQVIPIRGEPATEGEVVLIKKALDGKPLPEFYAETVKVVPKRHIVWYVHRKEDDASRNFVDFGLTETACGVRFDIRYYAQSRLSAEALLEQRKMFDAGLRELAVAFKNHCEVK